MKNGNLVSKTSLAKRILFNMKTTLLERGYFIFSVFLNFPVFSSHGKK